MANLATPLPVGYAFIAGMVASVNPRGFLLQPSYISYHLGTEEGAFSQTPVRDWKSSDVAVPLFN
jgi:cytochrome c biogenesis protein CcdA